MASSLSDPKINQIARGDWLPDRAKWSYLALSGLSALSREKNIPLSQIINHTWSITHISRTERRWTTKRDRGAGPKSTEKKCQLMSYIEIEDFNRGSAVTRLVPDFSTVLIPEREREECSEIKSKVHELVVTFYFSLDLNLRSQKTVQVSFTVIFGVNHFNMGDRSLGLN